MNTATQIEKTTGSLYFDCFKEFNYDQWLNQGKLLSDQLGLSEEVIKDKVCLDGGCGHSSLLYQLRNLGARHVVGVDLEPCPPQDIFKNLENVKIKQASLMEKLPLEDNSFDIVLSSGVLHHTTHPEKGFENMARVLKPGGLMVLGVYGKHGLFPYCLSLARIFTVKIPIISKKLVEKFIDMLKLDPIWRYQLLDYLYVPILRRYSVEQVKKDFFEKNNIENARRISNISENKAKTHNQNKTSYSYDHRKLKNKILFGYGFIVVAGNKKKSESF